MCAFGLFGGQTCQKRIRRAANNVIDFVARDAFVKQRVSPVVQRIFDERERSDEYYFTWNFIANTVQRTRMSAINNRFREFYTDCQRPRPPFSAFFSITNRATISLVQTTRLFRRYPLFSLLQYLRHVRTIDTR